MYEPTASLARLGWVGGVDDDFVGETVGVLAHERLGRDPRCGENDGLGADQ
jgi:hypothetical protein